MNNSKLHDINEPSTEVQRCASTSSYSNTSGKHHEGPTKPKEVTITDLDEIQTYPDEFRVTLEMNSKILTPGFGHLKYGIDGKNCHHSQIVRN